MHNLFWVDDGHPMLCEMAGWKNKTWHEMHPSVLCSAKGNQGLVWGFGSFGVLGGQTNSGSEKEAGKSL